MNLTAARQLASYAIPPLLKAQLLQCGFTTTTDIAGLRPSDLSREMGISHYEANQIMEAVNKPRAKGTSALELLNKPIEGIVTLSQALDQLLGGKGVRVAQVTEFCGVPGIGKTQLGMQIACDAALPTIFEGLGGEAIYMDTEGSFIADRCMQIAGALVHKVLTSARELNRDTEKLSQTFSEETILNGIHHFRIYDYVEQLATLATLEKFLKENQKVKVLIVDSVAFHFRRGFEDFSLRARVLMGMAQHLLKLAQQFDIAVVVMNQVTTRFQSERSNHASIAPALGESWAHACTNRVMLSWNNGIRQARLLKSPSCKTGCVSYAVLPDGIRDHVEEESNVSQEC